MFSQDEIKSMIEQKLSGCTVEVSDFAGDGDHFEVKVIYSGFSGKNSLQRHRMVYEALGNKVGNEIHALKLQTKTPEEK
jgi:acid stress-induced BolA-like protein IbaG/YrbA